MYVCMGCKGNVAGGKRDKTMSSRYEILKK